jgi:hypothetical protein
MQMKAASGVEDWPARLISAGDDKEMLRKVLWSVLTHLSVALVETNLQKSVIVPTSSTSRDELVQSLNDSEVEEWKIVVQNGDWVGLITHRTCLSSSRFQ